MFPHLHDHAMIHGSNMFPLFNSPTATDYHEFIEVREDPTSKIETEWVVYADEIQYFVSLS